MYQSWGRYFLALMLAASVSGCSSPKSDGQGLKPENLAGCPDRPNCVSSEAQDAEHAIHPFRLKNDPAAGWQAIRRVVDSLPRSTVVENTDRYLHVECKSRLFGFIDDLELQHDPKTAFIAVRSASRVGFSDLGVNRRRVEALRQKLQQAGIIY